MYDPYPYDIDNDTEETWIFYENNSLKVTTKHFKEYPEDPNASVNIYWTQFLIEGSKIYLPADDAFIYLNYKFSKNYTQLNLSISQVYDYRKYNKVE